MKYRPGILRIYCLLIDYLVFRSIFLPRVIGVLMAFAGLGWLTFLYLPLAQYLSPNQVTESTGSFLEKRAADFYQSAALVLSFAVLHARCRLSPQFHSGQQSWPFIQQLVAENETRPLRT
jgi:hypothetical protein